MTDTKKQLTEEEWKFLDAAYVKEYTRCADKEVKIYVSADVYQRILEAYKKPSI
jgi:hypothetical protein